MRMRIMVMEAPTYARSSASTVGSSVDSSDGDGDGSRGGGSVEPQEASKKEKHKKKKKSRKKRIKEKLKSVVAPVVASLENERAAGGPSEASATAGEASGEGEGEGQDGALRSSAARIAASMDFCGSVGRDLGRAEREDPGGAADAAAAAPPPSSGGRRSFFASGPRYNAMRVRNEQSLRNIQAMQARLDRMCQRRPGGGGGGTVRPHSLSLWDQDLSGEVDLPYANEIPEEEEGGDAVDWGDGGSSSRRSSFERRHSVQIVGMRESLRASMIGMHDRNQSDILQLEYKLGEMRRERDEAIGRSEKLASENESLREESAASKQRADQLSATNGDLVKKIGRIAVKAQKQEEAFRDGQRAQRRANEALQKKMSDVAQENNDLANRNRSMTTSVQTAEGMMDTVAQFREAQTAMVEMYEERLAGLEGELARAKASRGTLSERLAASNEECRELRSRLEDATEAGRTYEGQIAELNADREACQDELDEVYEMYEVLQREMEVAVRTLEQTGVLSSSGVGGEREDGARKTIF